jgi:hypothetical protein
MNIKVNKMRAINNDVQEAVQYWAKKGKMVDVFYHNSHKPGLDEFEFAYRSAQSIVKGYFGLGIFTHSGSDQYFKKFGKVEYAVVVKKGAGKTMEEEDGNRHMETFIQQQQVLEIIEL